MEDIVKQEEIDESLFPDEISPFTSLIKESNNLTNQIIAENDPDKLNDLTQLFTMNKKKRDIVRSNKLSNLLEIIDDEVFTRFTSLPESFDNDQLLKYMESTQRSITNMEQAAQQVPQIQINNQKNEIHIDSGLSRESRNRVLEAVNSILNNAKSADVIDIEDN